MTRSEFDWRFVLRHTVLPAVTAVVALLVLAFSLRMHDAEKSVYEQTSVDQGAIHEDYDALVYRRRLVDDYHRRYDQLLELGFVGVESRLEWVETLRETALEMTLPRVSYAIEPQLRVVAPVESIMAGANTEVHLSRMQLEVGLVHELELLRLIDELQRNVPGLIKVDRCDLAWEAGDADRLGVAANILASCSLSIFSIVTSDVGRGTVSS